MYFAGVSANIVRFNVDGDAPGQYYVYQYQEKVGCFQQNDDCFAYEKIGTWDEK